MIVTVDVVKEVLRELKLAGMVAVRVAAMPAGSACWRSQPLDEAFYDAICKHNGGAQASGQNKELSLNRCEY